MILRIQETKQNRNFRNFIINKFSLQWDFLMQFNLSGFLCPLYACLKVLEPIIMICLHFKLFLHCWKIATYILRVFSFNVDHLYIFYAKFFSTGLARRCEIWDNTFCVYISLCFIIDQIIPGLLKMNWYPMLYSFNVHIMIVLLQSDENKCANNISYNSQVFAYEIIFDSVIMDHIILGNSVEFVQKHKVLLFQICAINISYNSQMCAYGIIFDSVIMNHIILCYSAEFVQKFQALL